MKVSWRPYGSLQNKNNENGCTLWRSECRDKRIEGRNQSRQLFWILQTTFLWIREKKQDKEKGKEREFAEPCFLFISKYVPNSFAKIYYFVNCKTAEKGKLGSLQAKPWFQKWRERAPNFKNLKKNWELVFSVTFGFKKIIQWQLEFLSAAAF